VRTYATLKSESFGTDVQRTLDTIELGMDPRDALEKMIQADMATKLAENLDRAFLEHVLKLRRRQCVMCGRFRRKRPICGRCWVRKNRRGRAKA